eukprot:SAG11_NODE_4301_length_1963_cov_1.298820_2_plen_363_part_01
MLQTMPGTFAKGQNICGRIIRGNNAGVPNFGGMAQLIYRNFSVRQLAMSKSLSTAATSRFFHYSLGREGTIRLFMPSRQCSSTPRGFGKFKGGRTSKSPEGAAQPKPSSSTGNSSRGAGAGKRGSDGKISGAAGGGGGGSGGGGGKKGGPGKKDDKGWGWLPEGADNTRTLALLLGAAGTMSLLSMMGGSSGDKSKEITFVEFCSQLVTSGEVEKVIVSNNSRANVYMKPADGVSGDSSLKYHFSIGSIEVFERRLEEIQRQQNIDTFEFIPVQFKSEMSLLVEASRFIPVLLLAGFFLYMRRSMGGMPGMGGGGGGIGGGRNPFSMGKSPATLFNKEEAIGVQFKDVAGLEEAKTEVQEFVH